MTPRSLFEVIIRLFGSFCFFTTAFQIIQTAVAWFAPYFGFDSFFAELDFYVAQQLIGTLFTGTLGLVLFGYAPQFALMVYPNSSAQENNESEIQVANSKFGPEDVYKVAFIVFGLSLLSRVIEPLSFLAVDFFRPGGGLAFTTMDREIAQVLINTVVGTALVFRSGWLAKILDSEKSPASKPTYPKLNFGMIVVLFILFAIFLSVIRLIVISQR